MPKAGEAVSLQDLSAPAKRPMFRFTIPEKYATEIKNIGLVQLTLDEEKMAFQLAKEDASQAMVEQVKVALVSVNNKPVNTADGSSDKALGAMNPIIRAFVLAAYQRLHSPEQKDVSTFLESQSVSIG